MFLGIQSDKYINLFQPIFNMFALITKKPLSGLLSKVSSLIITLLNLSSHISLIKVTLRILCKDLGSSQETKVRLRMLFAYFPFTKQTLWKLFSSQVYTTIPWSRQSGGFVISLEMKLIFFADFFIFFRTCNLYNSREY